MTYTVSKQFPWQGPPGRQTIRLCRMFGLTLDRLSDRAPVHQCTLQIAPGDVIFITGPSGAGKSVLLCELEEAVPESESINLATIGLPNDRTVIDCFDEDIVTALKTLSLVGLSEVFSVVNRPCYLSEGQKYRFRLAKAIQSGKRFVFGDEFCSELDRITAATVAFNIHKFAKRTDTTFLLASSNDDILLDLAPDVLVIKDFSGPAEVIYKTARQ